MALANGTQLGPYEITSVIGAGGMGEVYRATDTRLGRAVAIKLLPEAVAADVSLRQRFEREARTVSRLNHPNICTLHDIGEFDGRPYIVMEVVEGRTLEQLLTAGRMEPGRILELSIQLADGLDAAHRQGVIHRDIKPANIVVTNRGQAKLLDFGLAKLAPHADRETGTDAHHAAPTMDDEQITRPRTAVGTIAYMSPEQARGEELDARTDVFSLGTVIYEMVTGTRAFPGQTTAVIFDAILNRAPTHPVHFAPDIPARLGEILSHAVEKRQDLRYQSAADLKADLLRAKRDLDSGQSVSLSTASQAATSAVTQAPASSGMSGAPASPSLADGVTSRAGVAPSRRVWLYGAFGVMVIAILWMVLLRPPASPVAPVSQTTIATPSSPALPPPPTPDPEAALLPGSDDDAGVTGTPDTSPPPVVPAPAPAPATPAPQPRSTPDPPAPDTISGTEQTPPTPDPPSVTPLAAPTGTLTPSEVPTAAPTAPAIEPPPATPVPAVESSPLTVADPPELPAGPSPADDERAIRQVLATFEQSIENKDVGQYRSVRPTLSPDDERRLRAGFDAVESQAVTLQVRSLEVRGDRATVVVARTDTIRVDGQEQSQDSMQTMRLERRADGWVILEISG